jgi:hypothetical protein
MKPHNPSSATHVIAESIRTQLGTEAVIPITPGSPKCAVVIVQAPDTPARSAGGAAEPTASPNSGLAGMVSWRMRCF